MRRLAYMHNLPLRMPKLKIPNSGKLPRGKQKHTSKVINMLKLFMDIYVFNEIKINDILLYLTVSSTTYMLYKNSNFEKRVCGSS